MRLYPSVMPHVTPIAITLKKELRGRMLATRAEAKRQTPDAPLSLRDVFSEKINLLPSTIIAAYVARDSEMDPAPLVKALRQRGHRMALPLMMGKDRPLSFRVWNQDDVLETGPMSLLQPALSCAVVAPDVFLVPLLAFDRRKNRLGYGGGYYDRTLKEHQSHRSILTIGLAYACQEVPEVPTGPQDVPLDRIITERQSF